jgi:hypothetical protein
MKFNIINHGSLIGFTPVDDTAQTWWDEHVQECHQMGDQYLVGHRFAQDIIDGIQAASSQTTNRGEGGPIRHKQD